MFLCCQPPVSPAFIQQVPATSTIPATVSYVAPPTQQGAAQYVQTQQVQQVYYTTPQGQVIVQQQPVLPQAVFSGQPQVVTVTEPSQVSSHGNRTKSGQ